MTMEQDKDILYICVKLDKRSKNSLVEFAKEVFGEDGECRRYFCDHLTLAFGRECELYDMSLLGTKVSFFEIDPDTGDISGEATSEVTNFTTLGPNLLEFPFPAALETGVSYFAVPSRSADGDRWFTGAGKAAEIVHAE